MATTETQAQLAERLHKDGRSITPISLRQQFHAVNEQANGLWRFNDGSAGFFSEFEKIEYADWTDNIPEYNRQMTEWIDSGGRGDAPTKKQRIVKQIPAFKALAEGQSVATTDATPPPMAAAAPVSEKTKSARKLNLES